MFIATNVWLLFNIDITSTVSPIWGISLALLMWQLSTLKFHIMNILYVGQLNGNEANEVRFREIP